MAPKKVELISKKRNLNISQNLVRNDQYNINNWTAYGSENSPDYVKVIQNFQNQVNVSEKSTKHILGTFSFI
jgi:hypothetical protein